jgi:hypothetical protein
MDYLLVNRVYLVMSLLFERLGPFLKDSEFPDVEETLAHQELDVRYWLINGWSVYLRESYSFETFDLQVDYAYVLMDETDQMVFSCDNSPHHAQVKTFPHHKHRYPKDQFKATEFSGRFEDFLDEVLWEISRGR